MTSLLLFLTRCSTRVGLKSFLNWMKQQQKKIFPERINYTSSKNELYDVYFTLEFDTMNQRSWFTQILSRAFQLKINFCSKISQLHPKITLKNIASKEMKRTYLAKMLLQKWFWPILRSAGGRGAPLDITALKLGEVYELHRYLKSKVCYFIFFAKLIFCVILLIGFLSSVHFKRGVWQKLLQSFMLPFASNKS